MAEEKHTECILKHTPHAKWGSFLLVLGALSERRGVLGPGAPGAQPSWGSRPEERHLCPSLGRAGQQGGNGSHGHAPGSTFVAAWR